VRSEKMTRLHINVGREEGVRPGDIVGAIANEGDLPGNAIGAIEIHGHYSLVDVPSKQVRRLLKALQNTRIRSHTIKFTILSAQSD